jgi:hypothetical protein
VFLTGSDGVWWLDPIEGALTLEFDSLTSAQAALATCDGRDEYLLEGLVLGAARRGVERRPDQIYAFAPPPILSGSFDFDHLMVMDFEVGMSVQGQLHRQLQAMPPGTTISGFQFNEDS